MPSTKINTATPHDAALKMFAEIVGVLAITLIAGISDNVGRLMVVFMAGIMVMWALTHVPQLSKMMGNL